MRLETELKAIGYQMDAETFQTEISDAWGILNRDCSIDNFMCRPWDHREFCTMIRHRLGLNETCDDLILRTLLNTRKRGFSRQSQERQSRQQLKTEIRAIGLDIDPTKFKTAIHSVFEDVYKLFSVDQLLMRWRDSLHFCVLIRYALGMPDSLAANELILRTLLNSRRKGELSLRDRVTKHAGV